MDEEIQIKDSASAKHFLENAKNVNKKFKGKIEFKNVNFFYNAGEHIIKNLSFKINPGEHVAFVGPTGSGKTTIIRLLCRLYEPQSGQILIDDIDIKDITIRLTKSAMTPTAPLPKTSAKASTSFVNLVNNSPTHFIVILKR